jgi:hypothetical protein
MTLYRDKTKLTIVILKVKDKRLSLTLKVIKAQIMRSILVYQMATFQHNLKVYKMKYLINGFWL